MLNGIGFAKITHCVNMLNVLSEDKELNLHLTGSRFFDSSSIGDYDFFVNDSQRAREILHNLDFMVLSVHNEDYENVQGVNCICRKIFQDNSPSIDVQLVTDAEKKLKAQDLIKALNGSGYLKTDFRFMHKRHKKSVWETVMSSL